jgi:hypothetical protein
VVLFLLILLVLFLAGLGFAWHLVWLAALVVLVLWAARWFVTRSRT